MLPLDHTHVLQRVSFLLVLMLLQNTSDNKQLHMSLIAEGAVGMWELLSGVTAVGSLITGASLRGLMDALRKPILSVELQLPAICAAWHVCAATKPRERLVQVTTTRCLTRLLVEVECVMHIDLQESHVCRWRNPV